ncbi:MAG: Uncharacterized protein G01um101470_70 [Parcubacteria group bacterium Gr01-1014_70]|nr:MAG: Uncharacterized protein G01um101470_70 [Parcubacteria group bacterium Gr01-1014_70]
MFNNKHKIKKQVVVLCMLMLALASFAYAVDYKLLAPLPGGSVQLPADETGFSFYAQNFYLFLLSAAVILALVMLVIGGVEYVASAGNTSLLGDAKGRMLNALLGLLLALASWLILNLINPDLVDFSLPIKEINLPVRTASPTP